MTSAHSPCAPNRPVHRRSISLSERTRQRIRTMLDQNTFAILDTEITPIVATAFRADFTDNPGAGACLLELDAFATRPEVAPAIVINPQPTSGTKKSCIIVSVLARGGALKYQWKFNGQVIPGATSATFCFDTAKAPGEGTSKGGGSKEA